MTAKTWHFSLAFSRAFGKVIVHVHGALEVATAPELRARLVDLIDGQGNAHVIIDLRATTFVDAAGLSVLVDAAARMREKGGELVLSGSTDAVAHAIRAAGLDTVFLVTPAWAHPVHGRAGARADLGQSGSRRPG